MRCDARTFIVVWLPPLEGLLLIQRTLHIHYTLEIQHHVWGGVVCMSYLSFLCLLLSCTAAYTRIKKIHCSVWSRLGNRIGFLASVNSILYVHVKNRTQIFIKLNLQNINHIYLRKVILTISFKRPLHELYKLDLSHIWMEDIVWCFTRRQYSL